jgi:Tfp pilus assembly protein PilF
MSHPRAQIELQLARANMDKNNLTTARAVLSRVLVEQPNNIDAIKLNADLEDRELKRNAILLAARSCATRDQWTCVWRNAGNALVIDASSAEAKQLLTQAMWQSELNSRTGATPPLGVNRAP